MPSRVTYDQMNCGATADGVNPSGQASSPPTLKKATTSTRKRTTDARLGSSSTSSKDQNLKPTGRKSKAVIDLTADDHNEVAKVPTKKRAREDGDVTPRKKAKATKDVSEKRLARFRVKAPQKFWDYHERAMTQRMFVLDRQRRYSDYCPHGTTDCPAETIKLAGSTGNVYTINISHIPTCTCPDFRKGNKQCKHIIHVLVKVLKATTPLNYQLAFLTSELREIFEHAGPLPVEQIMEEDKDGNRRPVGGDCPICCCELDDVVEQVVWCRAACGNNLHKSCFDQWATSRRGQQVTCPYCRTAWSDGGDLKALGQLGQVNEEGYVNLSSELGLTGRRDYSSYHSVWVRQQMRNGTIHDAGQGEDWY